MYVIEGKRVKHVEIFPSWLFPGRAPRTAQLGYSFAIIPYQCLLHYRVSVCHHLSTYPSQQTMFNVSAIDIGSIQRNTNQIQLGKIFHYTVDLVLISIILAALRKNTGLR